MLQNPYNPLGIQWQDNHLIQGRVSQDDFFFLKQKYPYYPGLVDKIVSNLFKAVIDELRKRDNETHIDTALYIDDPSYRILDEVIDGLTYMARRSVGEHSVGGPTVAQHDAGGVDGFYSEVQRSAVVSPDPKSRIKTRKRSSKGTKKKEEQR
jgi:hypothetical protein